MKEIFDHQGKRVDQVYSSYRAIGYSFIVLAILIILICIANLI
jgi:hypothetical protein